MTAPNDEDREALDKAGWLDETKMYGGFVGQSVLELMAVFRAQDHSGTTARMTIALMAALVDRRPVPKANLPMRPS